MGDISKNHNQGFTILEILIVVILMGIIGVIAMPSTGLIRKQEVKKLAKEICLDLTSQRMKAMTTTGANYSMELTSTAGLGFYNGYELSTFDGAVTSVLREGEKDNSKKIHITMQASEGETGYTSNPTMIQFDHYGRMMDTQLPKGKDIYMLEISIEYNEVKTVVKFNGKTGQYIIEK